MKFTLEIQCDNEAFEDLHAETQRILAVAWRMVGEGQNDGKLRDVNGNTVGRFEFVED